MRLPDPKLAVVSDDRRICVTGVQHGARYEMTFRAGLPSAQGDALVRDVPITAYVRDRAPSLSFPGRAYVLPKSADAGLPIETVNLSEIDLTLRRVSDRNLIRAMQDDYFGRPLSSWAEARFAGELAEEIWTGSGAVETRLNAEVTTRLPMGEVVGDLPAGIYALTARVPGADPHDEAGATQWFVLSDIGLTTLAGTDGLTVVAVGSRMRRRSKGSRSRCCRAPTVRWARRRPMPGAWRASPQGSPGALAEPPRRCSPPRAARRTSHSCRSPTRPSTSRIAVSRGARPPGRSMPS